MWGDMGRLHAWALNMVSSGSELMMISTSFAVTYAQRAAPQIAKMMTATWTNESGGRGR